MRKWLLASILALAGLGVTANRAAAWNHYGVYVANPYYTAVAFPMITPSGWFSNAYYFPWYYPWYVNYNYSYGYYSNWWMAGGVAYYAGQQIPVFRPVVVAPNINITIVEEKKGPVLPPPKKELKKEFPKPEGKVSIHLPADAKLYFNGVAAAGTGETRTFVTPELNPGQEYEYVLTAEIVRNGDVMRTTARAIVRAGEVTDVTLTPTAAVVK